VERQDRVHAENSVKNALDQKKKLQKKCSRLREERHMLQNILVRIFSSCGTHCFRSCYQFTFAPCSLCSMQEQAKDTLKQSREAWSAQDEHLKHRIQQLTHENSALRGAAFTRTNS